MKVYTIIDDDGGLCGVYTSKESLNVALNGQTDWFVKEVETDQGQLRPIWGIRRKNETKEIVKVNGPHYRFVDDKYVDTMKNEDGEFSWFLIQAESKDEAIRIAKVMQ